MLLLGRVVETLSVKGVRSGSSIFYYKRYKRFPLVDRNMKSVSMGKNL